MSIEQMIQYDTECERGSQVTVDPFGFGAGIAALTCEGHVISGCAGGRTKRSGSGLT